MASSKYVDCELYLTGRRQARLSVGQREYSGHPDLGPILERRLQEVTHEPERYGSRLFEALFPSGDDLRTGYQVSLTTAWDQGKQLRLRLHVAAEAPPDLHDLNWELLYDFKQNIALGRSEKTAFSRYLGVPFEQGQPVAGRPRLLVVVACPNNLAEYGLSEFDREEVEHQIRHALSPLADLMSWEVLKGRASVERIRDRLVADEFHALHLVAHGWLAAEEAVARLALEAADGSVDFVDEKPFAEVFAGRRDLRLISLIACHGGALSGRDPFSGLGPALIRESVPAVVAMRREISLAGASHFTEHFYRNLARSGQVDVAANEARFQLYLGKSPEWGTPALFMRLAEGRLWRSRGATEDEDRAERIESQPLGTAESEEESESPKPVVKTLVVSELVDRARWIKELGDEPMAEILRGHDRLARDLLQEHEGLEADGGGGFLALFELPLSAVRWALAFHQAIAELSAEFEVELACRIAIHQGEIILTETPFQDIARGARPLSVEGLDRQIATRLTSLAMEGQTLISSFAFDRARRSVGGTVADEQLRWLAHGDYLLPESLTPKAVFEVGIEGVAPLSAPDDTDTVRRAVGDQTILGWRPGIGLRVPGRSSWVLERKFSEGGFGEVWLASHEKMGEQRVFKFCFEHKRLRALQREITLFRVLRKYLDDRSDIVRILDWNFEEAPYFIESEYAADGNLVEWANEQGGIDRVPRAQRLEIIAQLSDALAAAHSVGVLHKDVKPTNVLIATGKDGALQVRLADFGIGSVTERDRLEAAGITVLGLTEKTEEASSDSGTRLYMAPELLEGRPATLQTDIYAVGVMLYQIVIGDFTRALAPGWRRDVNDELLCEDIAFAVDGSSKRRLGNAVRLAERLRTLGERRQELKAERLEREQARKAQEALERSKKRRKQVAVAIGVLIIFSGIMTFLTVFAFKQARRANSEFSNAEQMFEFTRGLFTGGSGPSASRDSLDKPISVHELLRKSADKVRGGLTDQPERQVLLMSDIGTMSYRMGLYELAESLYRDALEIFESFAVFEGSDVAKMRNNLALSVEAQGRYNEARRLYVDTLGILEESKGPKHPLVATALKNLCDFYQVQKEYDTAESCHKKALEIREEVLGPFHPKVARSLNSLGALYKDQKRFEEATQVFLRSLEIRKTELGPDDWSVGVGLFNLGELYQSQGDHKEAENLYRDALRIFDMAGVEHLHISYPLHGLATILRDQKNYGESEKYFRRALAIRKEAGGSKLINETLSEYVELLRRMKREGEAKLFEEMIDTSSSRQ